MVLDDGPTENGFNVLKLSGPVRRIRESRRRLFRAIYGIFVDRFGCKREGGPRDRLGGDLYFIIDKLSYIKSMGFDAIYLTPVFRAMSYHRYDVIDYLNVDDDLGGNKAFKELLRSS
ncbi:alpha-amylase family glycosyl hydrolase [Vulcanisaeta distributa]|uniref:alpha-amylase family glycosyl hydrolase n=1 Tax=Vulcanisaeta distributa TaxID=164451 RepID=UPI000A43E3DD|nr:alpha-amylase family glycosyl hydrolase [Vulcanisaeta distributa]